MKHGCISAFFFLAVLCGACAPPEPALPPEMESKPFLGYLLADDDAAAALADACGGEDPARKVKEIAVLEEAALRDLYLESEKIVRDPGLTMEQKRLGIEEMEFNERAGRIVAASLEGIERELGGARFEGFVEWAGAAWRRLKAKPFVVRRGLSSGLTYNVFATQYEANTSFEVAIPDKYIKFANLGWEHHSGYEGSDYKVKLSREGSEVTVPVLDVGPWNIDDNYWNPPSGPRPRRRFTDLPQGKPEAQAAYQDGYNGGKDQSGRRVLNPAGIDLAPQAAQQLGLAYLQNAWIDVTFTWEAPPLPRYAANFVNFSSPQRMTSGEEQTAWVEYRNEGSETWDTTNTRLGTTVPRDRDSPFFKDGNWINRQRPTAADHSNYDTGSVGRFSFVLLGPEVAQPEVFKEHFGLVQEGVTWFGPADDAVFFEITVSPRPAPDADADGHGDAAAGGDDCDDSDPAVHPGAEDACGDGKDQDCSGGDAPCPAEDADGDGHKAGASGGDDCDDADPARHPGAVEECGDGIDQDCDGSDVPCDGGESGSDGGGDGNGGTVVMGASGGCGCGSGPPAWPVAGVMAAVAGLLPLVFLRRRRQAEPGRSAAFSGDISDHATSP